jgi:hypothetical protein
MVMSQFHPFPILTPCFPNIHRILYRFILSLRNGRYSEHFSINIQYDSYTTWCTVTEL